MPPNAHVVSLKPELNDQGQLLLEMKVAGDSRNAALELVHRMEGSPHFQGTQVIQESQTQESTGISADIVAVYIPEPSAKLAETASRGGN